MDRTILFRVDLLAAVGDLGDGSAVEIQELMLQPPYDRETVRMDRIYSTMSDLYEDGLVDKEGKVGTEKSYFLTAEGREVLETRQEIIERALQE